LVRPRSSSLAAVSSTASTYDSNDRVSSDTYDNNGNTTLSGPNQYGYDFENRIVSVGNNVITVAYDGDGNRVSKTVNGVVTRYLVDTNNHTGYAQVVEELNGASQVTRRYAFGLDLVSQMDLASAALSYYGYDGHGSVRYRHKCGVSNNAGRTERNTPSSRIS